MQVESILPPTTIGLASLQALALDFWDGATPDLPAATATSLAQLVVLHLSCANWETCGQLPKTVTRLSAKF